MFPVLSWRSPSSRHPRVLGRASPRRIPAHVSVTNRATPNTSSPNAASLSHSFSRSPLIFSSVSAADTHSTRDICCVFFFIECHMQLDISEETIGTLAALFKTKMMTWMSATKPKWWWCKSSGTRVTQTWQGTGVVIQRQKLYIQLKPQYSLCSLSFYHHSQNIVFRANCVSRMLKHERGILLGGSIEIMNKKRFRVCHCKTQHFNYGKFPWDRAANTLPAL